MRTYPKIETLFQRDQDRRLTTIIKNPVYETISKWLVTEKIDGMNLCVHLDEKDEVTFGGRTDNAQIPGDLTMCLIKTFTPEKMKALRKDEDKIPITLFGEGYGAGVQRGGDYRKDKGFILFDVLVLDKYWLDDAAVTEIALKLDIPRVPIIGIKTLEELMSFAKEGFISPCAESKRMAEGIVARPIQPLYDKRMRRIIIKLKQKDWQ